MAFFNWALGTVNDIVNESCPADHVVSSSIRGYGKTGDTHIEATVIYIFVPNIVNTCWRRNGARYKLLECARRNQVEKIRPNSVLKAALHPG